MVSLNVQQYQFLRDDPRLMSNSSSLTGLMPYDDLLDSRLRANSMSLCTQLTCEQWNNVELRSLLLDNSIVKFTSPRAYAQGLSLLPS